MEEDEGSDGSMANEVGGGRKSSTRSSHPTKLEMATTAFNSAVDRVTELFGSHSNINNSSLTKRLLECIVTAWKEANGMSSSKNSTIDEKFCNDGKKELIKSLCGFDYPKDEYLPKLASLDSIKSLKIVAVILQTVLKQLNVGAEEYFAFRDKAHYNEQLVGTVCGFTGDVPQFADMAPVLRNSGGLHKKDFPLLYPIQCTGGAELSQLDCHSERVAELLLDCDSDEKMKLAEAAIKPAFQMVGVYIYKADLVLYTKSGLPIVCPIFLRKSNIADRFGDMADKVLVDLLSMTTTEYKKWLSEMDELFRFDPNNDSIGELSVKSNDDLNTIAINFDGPGCSSFPPSSTGHVINADSLVSSSFIPSLTSRVINADSLVGSSSRPVSTNNLIIPGSVASINTSREAFNTRGRAAANVFVNRNGLPSYRSRTSEKMPDLGPLNCFQITADSTQDIDQLLTSLPISTEYNVVQAKRLNSRTMAIKAYNTELMSKFTQATNDISSNCAITEWKELILPRVKMIKVPNGHSNEKAKAVCGAVDVLTSLNRGATHRDLILSVAPSQFMKLIALGRVFLDWNDSVRVFESTDVPRCAHCQKFSHIRKFCHAQLPTCALCAESHETKACKNTIGPNNVCANCMAQDFTFNHASFWHRCPSLAKAVFDLQSKMITSDADLELVEQKRRAQTEPKAIEDSDKPSNTGEPA